MSLKRALISTQCIGDYTFICFVSKPQKGLRAPIAFPYGGTTVGAKWRQIPVSRGHYIHNTVVSTCWCVLTKLQSYTLATSCSLSNTEMCSNLFFFLSKLSRGRRQCLGVRVLVRLWRLRSAQRNAQIVILTNIYYTILCSGCLPHLPCDGILHTTRVLYLIELDRRRFHTFMPNLLDLHGDYWAGFNIKCTSQHTWLSL